MDGLMFVAAERQVEALQGIARAGQHSTRTAWDRRTLEGTGWTMGWPLGEGLGWMDALGSGPFAGCSTTFPRHWS